MISKASVMMQKICLFVSGAGCLVSFHLSSSHSTWRICFIIAMVVSCVWHVNNTKCPHCGMVGSLKPKPFAKDAGRCIHCEKTVEYR